MRDGAELRSAWTDEGARPYTNLTPLQKMQDAYENIRL
jgi:hypothetical protein